MIAVMARVWTGIFRVRDLTSIIFIFIFIITILLIIIVIVVVVIWHSVYSEFFYLMSSFNFPYIRMLPLLSESLLTQCLSRDWCLTSLSLVTSLLTPLIRHHGIVKRLCSQSGKCYGNIIILI